MGLSNAQQYPHVSAMRFCMACGNGKTVGALVCWPCHNNLIMIHEEGYGPDVDRLIRFAEVSSERIARQIEGSRHQP